MYISKKATRIFLILLMVFPLTSLTQTKELITGKWKFYKHEAIVEGKTINPVAKGASWIYEFKADGTYFCWHSGNITSAPSEKGNWKLQKNGKELFFFNADLVPHQDLNILHDHPSTIVSVTKTNLVITEYRTEMAEGKSYYTRLGP